MHWSGHYERHILEAQLSDRASAAVKGTQYIVTDPGVLPLVDNQVTVSADAGSSDGEVCLALGSNKDVIGWLAGQPYVRVTGLNEWTTLATTKVSAQGSAADAGDDAVAFEGLRYRGLR